MTDCTLTELLGETDGIALYRGVGAGRPVLVRVLTGRPSPKEYIRFEQALEIAPLLPSRSAIRPISMTTVDGRAALVLEYFAGRPLARLMAGPTEPARFLTIAIGIASALTDVHRAIVHRDLRPDHVLVDLDAHEVKLTGFGIASLIPSERQALEPPPLIEGSLAYISPEQTRRTEHPIDARSDLYSLGIILYQLATGILPFRGRDLLDWVHCHIARAPTPPQQLVPGFPAVLSDLILKLLAKAPEERYQTAAGLRADLERCLEAYSRCGEILPFALGSRDLSDRFDIPPKLYGRDKEKAALDAVFRRVVDRGTAALFLITGAAGAGKTALVRQLNEPVLLARALFATGKGDQYRRETPYQALSLACSALVRQLLMRSDEEIGRWRASLVEAVGANGRLITEIVPEVVAVIGDQPPVVDLPVSQAEARLSQVFWRFFNTFASAEHPLVLFIDDLQWVDAASLRLLEHILEDRDTRYLLLVGAYRTAAGPPERRPVDELRSHAPSVEEVALAGLSVRDVDQLLQETLHHPLHETRDLAALVHERTAGNPFHTIEFLTALHREGLIRFDARTAAWSWNMEGVRAKPATENVADLLVERLAEVPRATLELLRMAACMGGRVGLQRLATVADRPVEEVRRDLLPALLAGLVLRSASGYEFVHDRVQQAAYALIAERDRPAWHYRIGRLLARNSPPAALGDEVFEVASHLTRGASTVADEAERRQIAAFDLEAGRRARAGSAYVLAAEHLSAGIALLDVTAWNLAYETTYDLHFELALCRYLTADPADAERILVELFAHARTRSDLAAVYRMKVELSWMLHDMDAAVDAVLACLQLFGVVFERHPTSESADEQHALTMAALGSRSIEDLRALPKTSSSEIEQLLATLSTAFPCAYWYDPNLHFSLSCLAVRIAIEHGVSTGGAHAFADFGMIIGARLGRYEDGNQFGRAAVELAERPGYENVRAKVYMVFGGMTAHWTRPLTDRTFIEKAFTSGVEVGDLLHASNSCVLLLQDLVGASARLDRAYERALAFRKFLLKTKFFAMEDVVVYETQLIDSLRTGGEASPAAWWRDPARHPRSRFGETPCLIARLQAAFLFGDYELAADLALEIAPIIYQIRGYWRVADYHFLAALALAARVPHLDDNAGRRLREQIDVHRDRYAAWAARCPENFLSRYALIRAEIAALDGDDQEAMKRYEEAIAEGRKAGSPANEAMAYEAAARFYRTRKLDLFADTYLREARSCYRQWGADGKVRWLDAQHPHLRDARAMAGGGAPAEQVDVAALATSLRAISCELVRPRLLSTTMRVLLQQAGADRGLFVKVSADELCAEVEAVLAGDELVVRAVRAGLEQTLYPVSVLRRACSLVEPVVLADAEQPGADGSDADYFAAHRPRSMLCLPVVRRASVIGAIYLENHGLRGAFSRETIRTTELLASQVAISLESADLYGGLVEENTRRRAAEAELIASRARLQSVLEHIVDGVIACDRTGRVTLVNRAFEVLTGFTRAELEAAPIAQIASALQLGWREADFVEAELPLRRALDGKTCVDVRATLVQVRTDVRLEIRISSAPIIGANREITGAVAILHDVSSAAQLELMKDQFIRVAAHELKTPVAIIRMGAQRLVRTPASESESIRSGAEALLRGADRIHRIIDAILLLSILQKGELQLAQEKIDLAALVSRVADDAARVHRRAVQLRTQAAAVRGDPERLKLALAHLVDNAHKYSPGGEAVEINLERRDRERDVLVHVCDRGVGIRRDQQKHIFERFFRAHTDTAYDFGGMGVGLYLSKEIARRHGGDLWFESEEGVGSTFHLKLPLWAADDAGAGATPGPS